MNDIDPAIARALATYQSAVFAKNVETFMHLYDPKVRVFDAWGVWLYEGAAAWQVAVEGWFTSLGAERVKVSFDEVEAVSGRDLAFVSAVVTYAGIDPQGEPLRSMQNRLTWGLRLTGSMARVVHEHTSAPIGFEDSKAILLRKP